VLHFSLLFVPRKSLLKVYHKLYSDVFFSFYRLHAENQIQVSLPFKAGNQNLVYHFIFIIGKPENRIALELYGLFYAWGIPGSLWLKFHTCRFSCLCDDLPLSFGNSYKKLIVRDF
jgi:hypothetical protein